MGNQTTSLGRNNMENIFLNVKDHSSPLGQNLNRKKHTKLTEGKTVQQNINFSPNTVEKIQKHFMEFCEVSLSPPWTWEGSLGGIFAQIEEEGS